MKLPVELLVVICLVVGLAPAYTVGELLAATALATLRAPLPDYSLHLWHGFNLPLLMSLVSMAGGAALFFLRRDALRRWQQRIAPLSARRSFETGIAALERRALASRSAWKRLAAALHGVDTRGAAGGARRVHGRSRRAVGHGLHADDRPDGRRWPGLAGTMLGCRGRCAAPARDSAGVPERVRVAGVAALHALLAPDLALTQISVEVVTVLLLVLALFYLPPEPPAPRILASPVRHARDLVLAAGGGVMLAACAYAVMTRPYDPVSGFYVDNAVPGGGGHNVVNVLLVDFRGFDTMGEICVLLIAGLAVQALLRGMRLPMPEAGPDGKAWSAQRHPLLLAMLARLMLPLTLLVAVFLLLRGHNLPGGGFIAALITSVALLLQYVASGVRWTEARIAPDYRAIAGGGILLAGLTGLGSWHSAFRS